MRRLRPLRASALRTVGRVVAVALASLAMATLAHAAERRELPLDQGWIAAVGKVEREGDAVVLRGEPGVEQAVLLFAPVSIAADDAAYLTIEHDGLAPQHELSIFFRNETGEHTLDVPNTTGAATVALPSDAGWNGTITELALVYGPAGSVPTLLDSNALRVHAVRFEADSFGARFRAWRTAVSRVDWRRGPSINVLPGNALVVLGGALVAAAVLFGNLLRGRGRRVVTAVFVAGFVLVQLVMIRQWLVLRDAAERESDARRAADKSLALDWQLVDVADKLKAAMAPDAVQTTQFALKFDDPYVAARLRYHLLPFRARAETVATIGSSGGERCIVTLSDRLDGPTAASKVDTAFGPIVLAIPGDAACRSSFSPR